MSIPAHIAAILAGSIKIAAVAPLPVSPTMQQGAPKAPRTHVDRRAPRVLELPELECHDMPSISGDCESLSFSFTE